MTTTKGRCLCGETTFEFSGPANWCGHCHCESCRRNCSAPFTTFVGVPRGAARFTGRVPAVYNSRLGVRRHFCANCGTPIAYDADHYPDEIHFYAASLEYPEDAVPQFHVHFAEKLPWIEAHDSLPRYPHSME
ncbi:MAG: GFA family protein [Proteobacteria bacterium]|nr:GFA family protein [Pseudomonadota bacterium]